MGASTAGELGGSLRVCVSFGGVPAGVVRDGQVDAETDLGPSVLTVRHRAQGGREAIDCGGLAESRQAVPPPPRGVVPVEHEERQVRVSLLSREIVSCAVEHAECAVPVRKGREELGLGGV